MKLDKKPQATSTETPAAAPSARPAGRGMVQLMGTLEGRSYDEQRAMVSPDGAGGDSKKEEGKPKNGKVILSARKGGNPLSREFWVGLDVGHCWVDVIKPDGRKDSWGFTANDVRNFPRYEPWKTVPGRVLHPDGSRGATGTMTRDIDEDQLQAAENWGNAQGSDYNLFGLNGGHSCATFAKDFFEEASGESAPSSMFGALIASPNDLSAAMNKKLEEEKAAAAEADTEAPAPAPATDTSREGE